MTVTEQAIELGLLPRENLPARACALARFSLLDWLTCGLAGVDEPLAAKLRDLAEIERGEPIASIFGGHAAPPRMAALVNGATAHALDYDDTHFAHVGHLSVAIYPAALAVAEEMGASGQEMIDAFLVGAEAAIRIGLVLGRAHYDLGFHQTATAGAFGATLAAGRLYKLDPGQMRAAIGLCATRSSGLKSQFGTMGKPLNAGFAASNGVECATLARLGFTSADDGLTGPQGFVPTHSPEASAPPAFDGRFLFEDNKYKLHACCHGTHAMIEALAEAKRNDPLTLQTVSALDLRTNPRWLRVCDLKRPRTGLEVKFSYGWLAGMVLRGDATGDDRVFTDALASDPELAGFAQKVTVQADQGLTDMQAACLLRLSDGGTIEVTHDLAAPLPQDVLAGKLRAKSAAVLGASGKALWDLLPELEAMDARTIGRRLRSI